MVFGGGDASGEGFGSKIAPFGVAPLIRRGFWGPLSKSSNWREMRNLLEAVREENGRGRLTGCEVWLTTDNSTAELSFCKGRSTSPELDEMVLELRLLAIRGNFVLRLLHIAGTRMIELGIDGLSRGELQLGALLEGNLPKTIPLHLDPLERSESLRSFLSQWLDPGYRVATPNDWFYGAQQAGQCGAAGLEPETWVWTLAPGAALTALEQLGAARLKRHDFL